MKQTTTSELLRMPALERKELMKHAFELGDKVAGKNGELIVKGVYIPLKTNKQLMVKVTVEAEITNRDYKRFKYSNVGFESSQEFIDRNRLLIKELTPERFKDIQIINFDVTSNICGAFIVIEGEL